MSGDTTFRLPEALEAAVRAELEQWRAGETITCADGDDLPVPGRRYSFGVVKNAQALGDFQVLRERGRRALRVHLGTDVKNGLARLRQAI